jgi:hypothetical protein
MAVGDLFLLSSFLFVALMLLVWLAKPVGTASVDAAGAH